MYMNNLIQFTWNKKEDRTTERVRHINHWVSYSNLTPIEHKHLNDINIKSLNVRALKCNS